MNDDPTSHERRAAVIARRPARPRHPAAAPPRHGPRRHLYRALDDDDHVYLAIDGQLVRIPVHVWAVIRQYPGVDLALADLSDAQLRLFAEQVVAVGRETFGADDPTILATPADEQIAQELAIVTAVRDRQPRVLAAIAELEALNRRREA